MAGNILKTGKVITKTAENMTLNANNGDLILNAAKSVKYSAKKDIIYDSYVASEVEQTEDLKVTKVTCDVTEVEIGNTYTFKAVQFSRKPKKDIDELKNLKWAYKIDDDNIQDFPRGSTDHSYSIATKQITIDKSLWDCKKLTIYAYIREKECEGVCETKIKVFEKIYIVGTEQHSATYGNKMMFPAQAIREVKENSEYNNMLTILMFSDGYNSDELNTVKRDGKKLFNNLNFIKINSVKELIDYINEGKDNVSRENVKIEEIKIFSHGLPSILDFGLDGNNEDSQRFKVSHVAQLKVDVFDMSAKIYSYACRTGNSDSRIVASTPGFSYGEDWLDVVKPKESLAQKLADHLNVTVYGYLRRSLYTSTWNDGGDERYGEAYMEIDDESINGLGSPKKWFLDWDEALWNPNGAYSKPTAAGSPKGIPSELYMFKKGQEPKKE